jgi:ATP-dependent helicase HrpA
MFRFEIVDEHGNPLASGRDGQRLRERITGREPARPTASTHVIEHKPVSADDFTTLPEYVAVAGPAGIDWLRWPALVDTGDGCAVRLFDDPGQASAVHRRGVFALLTQRLADRLPGVPAAADAAYRRLGTPAALQRELHLAIVQHLWPDDAEAPRDRAGFDALAARMQADLPAAGARMVHCVTETLAAWQALTRQLDQSTTLTLLEAAGDLRDQLQRLIHPGFVANTPPHWLGELPRYLAAATRRLEQARHDAAADRRRAQGLRPLWEGFWEHCPAQTTHPRQADWAHLRWLLEELRVALFAPQLGTREPVSVARLQKQLDALTGAPPARCGAAG